VIFQYSITFLVSYDLHWLTLRRAYVKPFSLLALDYAHLFNKQVLQTAITETEVW